LKCKEDALLQKRRELDLVLEEKKALQLQKAQSRLAAETEKRQMIE
jgi:hypothetical protein